MKLYNNLLFFTFIWKGLEKLALVFLIRAERFYAFQTTKKTVPAKGVKPSLEQLFTFYTGTGGISLS